MDERMIAQLDHMTHQLDHMVNRTEQLVSLHTRALACHCECMGMNAENMAAVCRDITAPYGEDAYDHVMKKWGLIDDKGEATEEV